MEPADIYQIEVYVIFAIHLALVLPGIVFFSLRVHLEPIRSRFWTLALAQAAVSPILFAFLVVNPWRLGCFLELTRIVMTVPFIIYPYLVRSFFLWTQYLIQDSILHLQAMKANGRQGRTSQLDHGSSEEKSRSGTGQEVKERKESKETKDESHAHIETISKVGKRPAQNITPWKFRVAVFFYRRKWIFSLASQVVIYLSIFAFFMVVTLLLYFLDPRVYPESVSSVPFEVLNPCDTKRTLLVVIVQSVIGIIGVVLGCVSLWQVSDAFLVKTELAWALCTALPLFFVWIASSFGSSFPVEICRFFWITLIYFFCATITLWVPVIASFSFQKEIEGAKQVSSTRESGIFHGSEVIRSIIKNPILYASFERYCKESWSYENLLFYIHAVRFRENPSEKIAQEAKKIWHIYFELGSDSEVNIDDGIREKIMERMNEGAITHELFKDAENQIAALLRYSIYPLWVLKPDYQKAIKAAGISNVLDLIQEEKKMPASLELQEQDHR